MPPSNPSPAPRHIRLGPELGRGAFGVVHLAEWTTPLGTPELVALKVLQVERPSRRRKGAREEAADTRWREISARLRDEARILTRLQHDHILRVYDLVQLDGKLAVVMEYVDGLDLEECLGGDDPIPPRAAMEVAGAVASALHAAHTATDEHGVPLNIVHRDVKPQNVRLKRTGTVKLLDFGVAKAVASERSARLTALVGTSPFMPPECYWLDSGRVRRSDNDSTPARDVFALGAMLFECLVGEPFNPHSDLQHNGMLAGSREGWEQFRDERLQHAAGFSADVVALLRSALTYTPEERPTAKAIEDRCFDLVAQLEGDDLKRWCRRNIDPERAPDRSAWLPLKADAADLSGDASFSTGMASTFAAAGDSSDESGGAPATQEFDAPADGTWADLPASDEPAAPPVAPSARVGWVFGLAALLVLVSAGLGSAALWTISRPSASGPTAAGPSTEAPPSDTKPEDANVSVPTQQAAAPNQQPTASPPLNERAATRSSATEPAKAPTKVANVEAAPVRPTPADTPPEPAAAVVAPPHRVLLSVSFLPPAATTSWRAADGTSGALTHGSANVPPGRVTLSWSGPNIDGTKTYTVTVPDAASASFKCSATAGRCQ